MTQIKVGQRVVRKPEFVDSEYLRILRSNGLAYRPLVVRSVDMERVYFEGQGVGAMFFTDRFIPVTPRNIFMAV